MVLTFSQSRSKGRASCLLRSPLRMILRLPHNHRCQAHNHRCQPHIHSCRSHNPRRHLEVNPMSHLKAISSSQQHNSRRRRRLARGKNITTNKAATTTRSELSINSTTINITNTTTINITTETRTRKAAITRTRNNTRGATRINNMLANMVAAAENTTPDAAKHLTIPLFRSIRAPEVRTRARARARAMREIIPESEPESRSLTFTKCRAVSVGVLV
mmetsp:Transcript_3163/g.5881  ORF Transcript_3163/g.5881 Transcript_3163/m.5881 type:complete len:217 (+) Transcript_3163:920-1570(+)